MKIGFQTAALVTAGISILAVSPCAAQGEIVPAPGGPVAPQTEARKRAFLIRLHNVAPRVMAFWLDSKHNMAPSELGLASPPSPFAAQNPLLLPEGVERIVAVDNQNALIIFGTAEGVDQLRDIIAFLDKPMLQVEIEARLLSIQSASLAGIWAALATPTAKDQPAMALLPSDFEKQLSEMLARNEARILTKRPSFTNDTTQGFSFGSPAPRGIPAPRMTMPNPIPEDFASPMPVIPPPRGLDAMPGMFNQKLQTPNWMAPFDMWIFYVTPTIKDGGSVTLEVKNAGSSNGKLQGTATLRDGQTLGFSLPRVAGASNRVFLLLTPRLVRRAANSSPTP